MQGVSYPYFYSVICYIRSSPTTFFFYITISFCADSIVVFNSVAMSVRDHTHCPVLVNSCFIAKNSDECRRGRGWTVENENNTKYNRLMNGDSRGGLAVWVSFGSSVG